MKAFKYFLFCLVLGVSVAIGADTPGVQVQQTESGSTVFLVDILALDTKQLSTMPWYKKPLGVASQIGENTVENVKDNPWSYILTAGAGALLLTPAGDKIVEDVSNLFGGSSSSEKKETPKTPQTEGLQVSGSGNQVTTWYDVGPIRVDGQDNVIVLNNSDL